MLKVKTEMNGNCFLARYKIMQECYSGGDKRHEIPVDNEYKAFSKCLDRYKNKCMDCNDYFSCKPKYQEQEDVVYQSNPSHFLDQELLEQNSKDALVGFGAAYAGYSAFNSYLAALISEYGFLVLFAPAL